MLCEYCGRKMNCWSMGVDAPWQAYEYYCRYSNCPINNPCDSCQKPTHPLELIKGECLRCVEDAQWDSLQEVA